MSLLLFQMSSISRQLIFFSYTSSTGVVFLSFSKIGLITEIPLDCMLQRALGHYLLQLQIVELSTSFEKVESVFIKLVRT